MRHPSSLSRREGALAPMAVVMMLCLLVMTAFAVDLSWVTLGQGELQNAADASALAGANQLMDHFVEYYLPKQSDSRKAKILETALSEARTAAKNCATYNRAGDAFSLTLRDADIEFGFRGTDGSYTALSKYDGFPNTVKVVLRRDDVANNPLPLYFGRIVGRTNLEIAASATATIYGGTVNDFKDNPVNNVGMLPITYDVNHWKNFLKTGKDPDGTATYDKDGNPTLQIFNAFKDKGNFGWLSLDDNHASSKELSGWIHNGLSDADRDTLFAHGLIPLDTRALNVYDWRGTTGYKSSNVQDINEYVGKSFVLPLFNPLVPTEIGYTPGLGKGSNYDYNIVQFVGVKITQAGKDNRDIIIQPSAVIEPSAVFKAGTLQPAQPSTDTWSVTVFSGPKLTQ